MRIYLQYIFFNLVLVFSILAFSPSRSLAQTRTKADSVKAKPADSPKYRPVDTMFKEARLKAFSGHKDTAKLIIDSILQKSPSYTDVKVFLARIYTWERKYDTSEMMLNNILSKEPKNEEAIDALIDLKYWTDHMDDAEALADKGISINAKSDRFHLKKAKVEVYRKRIDTALNILDTFIKYVPDTAANHYSRGYHDSLLSATYRRSVDDMFQAARSEAFSGHRDTARLIIDSIFRRSPNYMDVRVFLARLNTWDNKYDTAERTLRWVLERDPKNTEAINAMIDLKYWDNHPQEAESFANMGIAIEPGSDEFHLKKAKAMVDQKKMKGAADMLDSFISHHKDSSHQSRQYRESLKDVMIHNSITISYDQDIFNDKEDMTLKKVFTTNNNFSAPWHLLSIYYDRQTKFGSVIGRVNYANRFNNENGVQYEIDAYPTVAKKTYMYLNVGYSNYYPVFPYFRWGASIYRNLPYGLEAELGIRVLYFGPKPVNIFTGSVGKYWSNFWFSFRPYITPSDYTGLINRSFQFITRYYLSGDPDHYLSLSLSKGFSLDDHTKDLTLIQSDYAKYGTLPSYKIRLAYQQKIAARTYMNLRGAYEEDKLFYRKFRNDWTIGLGIEKRF